MPDGYLICALAKMQNQTGPNRLLQEQKASRTKKFRETTKCPNEFQLD